MKQNTKTAKIIAILFLISMSASMFYSIFYSSILELPLRELYSQKLNIITGSFLEIINCIAVTGIAAYLYSVLKKQSDALAISYVAFRAIECTTLLIGIIMGLSLIGLSNEYQQVSSPETSHFMMMASLMLKSKHFALQLAILICGVGGLIMTSLLYTSKLVPRFISTWGFVAYIFVTASSILDISGIIDTVHGNGIIMYIPGSIFEFILFPAWLFFKGFNSFDKVQD